MNPALQEQLNTAIDAIPGWRRDTVEVRILDGGITNSNWIATHDGTPHFLKLYGPGTEAFINRDSSIVAARQAHAMGIAPGVLHYDPLNGVEVTEFLTGYRASTTTDFERKEFLGRAIDLYAAFHSGDALAETKDVFTMTEEHVSQARELGARFPVDFEWMMHQYGKAKAAFLASGLDLVPCHNDPMPGNFMIRMDGDRVRDMKLIDFEFASNNERAYEIGVFLAEVFTDPATSLEMIERYYGHVRPDTVARVTVARAVADMKWGSWAVQQRQLSQWDFDYQKYGLWKYGRARVMFDDPGWDDWLRAI